jgi:hypothetical protein
VAYDRNGDGDFVDLIGGDPQRFLHSVIATSFRLIATSLDCVGAAFGSDGRGFVATGDPTQVFGFAP